MNECKHGSFWLEPDGKVQRRTTSYAGEQVKVYLDPPESASWSAKNDGGGWYWKSTTDPQIAALLAGLESRSPAADPVVAESHAAAPASAPAAIQSVPAAPEHMQPSNDATQLLVAAMRERNALTAAHADEDEKKIPAADQSNADELLKESMRARNKRDQR